MELRPGEKKPARSAAHGCRRARFLPNGVFETARKVKRTRPSPAFRSLPFSPRRLCAHPRGTENICLFCFIHLRVLTETRMNRIRECRRLTNSAIRLPIFTLGDSNTMRRQLPRLEEVVYLVGLRPRPLSNSLARAVAAY